MGAIRDLTSSFKIAFIIGGISFLASALLHCALSVDEPVEDQNDFEDEQTSTSKNKNQTALNV